MLTKLMAITGTVLVWLPILAPILFTIASFLRKRILRFDFLLPADLLLVALVGIGLLLWSSRLAHLRQGLIRWGVTVCAVMLIGGAGVAWVTGLATGEIEPTGWQWALVQTAIIGYTLSLVVIGLGGILLVSDLFKSSRSPSG